MAIINEECWWDLDGPPVRVSALNVPVPYNAALEAAAIPDEKDVITAALAMLGKG